MIRFMMFIKEGQGKVPRITQGKSISVIPNTADAAKEGTQFSGCTWAETDQPTMTEIGGILCQCTEAGGMPAQLQKAELGFIP